MPGNCSSCRIDARYQKICGLLLFCPRSLQPMTIFKREFKIAKARTNVAGVDRHSSLTTIFSRIKRGIKKERAEQTAAESDRQSLFVYLSDMGWTICSANENAEKGNENGRRDEDCSLLKADVPGRTEAIFGRAIKCS